MISLLEELATSKRFYAREGLITSEILRQKLEEHVRIDDALDLCWFANYGQDFIHLSPLYTSMLLMLDIPYMLLHSQPTLVTLMERLGTSATLFGYDHL